MFGSAPLLESAFTPELPFLHVLDGRACMLLLAALAAIVAAKWGRWAWEELHRFIVLFRLIILLHLGQLVLLCCDAGVMLTVFSLCIVGLNANIYIYIYIYIHMYIYIYSYQYM